MFLSCRWLRAAVLVALLALPSVPARAADNIDPNDDGSQYAYGENIGWLNAEPSGDGGPGIEVGDQALTGYMWGESVGWVSLSCTNTGSCGTVDYGVANDGLGGLSGFAWAENVGWISFSCTNTSSCASGDYGVTIDPQSGDFAGQAWGENVGFISFASDGPNPFRVTSSWNACSPLAGTQDLTLFWTPGVTQLTWSNVPLANGYDLVRGDLSMLRGTGDFAAATETCVVDDAQGTAATDSDDPAPGEGAWFLVRAVGCSTGTYDATGPSQQASRDAAIQASGNDCS